jgi:hypothetical protein
MGQDPQPISLEKLKDLVNNRTERESVKKLS